MTSQVGWLCRCTSYFLLLVSPVFLTLRKKLNVQIQKLSLKCKLYVCCAMWGNTFMFYFIIIYLKNKCLAFLFLVVFFFRRQLLPANHKMDRRRANGEGKWCHHHAGGKQDGPRRQKVICSSLFLPLCQWAPSCKSILMKSLIVAAGLSILSSSVLPEVALDLPLCGCQSCDSQVFQIALVKDIDDENYNRKPRKRIFVSFGNVFSLTIYCVILFIHFLMK